MKYMRRTAGYTWTDYKTNAQIAKELKITPILDKLLEYKRSWIQHVTCRMPRNRLPRVMKHYFPTGRRNHGRPLKRLLDTWDRNGSTSGPTAWKIYHDDVDDDRWRYHPKHVEQFTDKINCVQLHLVGLLLTYIYLPEDVFRPTILTSTNAQAYENQFTHTMKYILPPTVWPLSGILNTMVVEITIIRT